MSDIKAKIHYIYHSGFTLETDNAFLIFDYYKHPDSNEYLANKDVLTPENLKSKKKVFIFSSHSHGDHFNPEILKWQQYNNNTEYILSSDIEIKYMRPNYTIISEGEEKSIKDIYVKAYGSTDIGISFLVKIDGLTIFHAGDLNWWHWKEDSLEERKLAEKAFKENISIIKAQQNNIDIAFFPVDSRLEEFYYVGGEHFIKELHPKILIPMHFGDDFSATRNFAEKFKIPQTTCIEITHGFQEILY